MILETLKNEISRALNSLKEILGEEEFHLTVLQKGLLSGHPQSLKSISKSTGYSMARLKKIESAALKKIAAKGTDLYWPNWRRIANPDEEQGFAE